MTAIESPRLTGGVFASVVLHGAIVAAFVVFHGSVPAAGPPTAQLHMIAAAAGPTQLGAAQPPAPTPAPVVTQPPPAPKAPPVSKTKSPAPTPKTKKPAPKPQPQSSATAPPADAKPVTQPAPPAGSTENGKGTDARNIDVGGVDFPYPEYLTHIANLVMSRFPAQGRPDLAAEVSFIIRRDGSVDPSSIKLVTPSKAYSFNQQALGAVEAASNNKAFGVLPPGYREDILPVTFRFTPSGR